MKSKAAIEAIGQIEELVSELLTSGKLTNREAVDILLNTAALCLIRERVDTSCSTADELLSKATSITSWMKRVELGLFYKDGIHPAPRSKQ